MTPRDHGASATPDFRALLWLDPDQVELARVVASLAGFTVALAGCPIATGRGRSPEVAAALGAEPIDDLLRSLVSADVDLVFFATARASDDDPTLDDPDVLTALRERNLKAASLEPAAASVRDVARRERSGPELVRFVPSMRRSRGFRGAQEVIEAIAPHRTLTIAHRGGAGQGSLAAKLFDAMDIVHAVLGEPETIDAAVAGPASPGGVHLEPGERLRELRGDLTANLRFGSGRSASMTLSDSAGRWFRGATLIAHGGCLRVDDKSFELVDPHGATADRSRTRVSSGASDDPPAAAAIADQIAALLDPRAQAPAPIDNLAVLAMCEAALLSARTGQGESPATILRMAGAA